MAHVAKGAQLRLWLARRLPREAERVLSWLLVAEFVRGDGPGEAAAAPRDGPWPPWAPASVRANGLRRGGVATKGKVLTRNKNKTTETKTKQTKRKAATLFGLTAVDPAHF